MAANNQGVNHNILSVNIPLRITVGVFCVLTVCILSIAYIKLPKYRQETTFISTLIAVASAIYTAYYTSEAVKSNVNFAKMDKAVHYATLWQDSVINEANKSSRKIIINVGNIIDENEKIDKINQIIKENNNKGEEDLLVTLNFLEQIAILFFNKTVDGNLLKSYYYTIVIRYWESLSPWIKRRRSTGKRDRIYIYLERLYDDWRDNPPPLP